MRTCCLLVAAFTAGWTAWRLTRTAMGQLPAAAMMETLLLQLRTRYLDRVAPFHEQEVVQVIVGDLIEQRKDNSKKLDMGQEQLIAWFDHYSNLDPDAKGQPVKFF